jgi:hypothetical protein
VNCSCGRPEKDNPAPIGIQRDSNDKFSLILWNCRCGSTRAIPWAKASENLRLDAIKKEMDKLRVKI